MSATRRLFNLCAALATATLAGPLWSLDAEAQVTTVVSTASDGVTEGLGAMGNGLAISADGRYVVFAMSASNLVPGDNNGVGDVFVKDRQTNATTRVSVASDGTERSEQSGQAGADISDDGQFVVFTSNAAFVADDTNTCGDPAGPCQDIYLHNRATGQTTRVSVATGGAQANHFSEWPSISGDGRYIAFASHASNLVPGDSNNAADIFVHDRQTATTTRVSLTSTGEQGASGLHSHTPKLNGDGSIVAFRSNALLDEPPRPVLRRQLRARLCARSKHGRHHAGSAAALQRGNRRSSLPLRCPSRSRPMAAGWPRPPTMVPPGRSATSRFSSTTA